MSDKIIQGKVYVVGDDINTDAIIPAKYLNTMNPQFLGKHVFEGLDKNKYFIDFLNKDKTCNYKIIVAGKNFGCGSSREHAPIALHSAGIRAVVAYSFARIYFRNSINGGIILPLETEFDLSGKIQTGEELKILLSEFKIINLTTNETYFIKPFGPVEDIIEAGGLTNYNKKLSLNINKNEI